MSSHTRGTGLALLMLLPGMAAAGEAGSTDAVQIPYQSFQLPNGMTFIVHEDHSVPLAHVEIWYKVGSQNEKPGLTGFAHLFEHLMFQGSEHFDDEYFAPLQAVGAEVNGSTNTDRTNYYERLPSNYLDLAFYMEADRLGWLLPALTQEKLDNQREVVKNERRQRYENVPYGLSRKVIVEAIYPEDHPYHWLTIGSQEDLDNASLEEVKDFFRTWYVPNNATMCVAGDVSLEEVKRAAERYFGEIPAGTVQPPLAPPQVKLDHEIRQTMEDKVSLPRLYMVWPTPAAFAPGDADLDVVSSVLTGGLGARLTKRLVYEKRIAQSVAAYQGSAQLGSLYYIDATAAPGHTLEEVEREIDDVLNELRKVGPTAEEVQRALNGWEAGFVFNMETVSAKAGQLCHYHYLAGDAGFMQQDLNRYLSVTPESARQAAMTWLRPDGRMVLHVVPASTGGEK